jgi:hypothetical protein
MENLGTIYADVQLRLDNLDRTIMQATTKLNNFDKIIISKTGKPAASAQKTFLGLSKTILGAVPGVGLLMAGSRGKVQATRGKHPACQLFRIFTIMLPRSEWRPLSRPLRNLRVFCFAA